MITNGWGAAPKSAISRDGTSSRRSRAAGSKARRSAVPEEPVSGKPGLRSSRARCGTGGPAGRCRAGENARTESTPRRDTAACEAVMRGNGTGTVSAWAAKAGARDRGRGSAPTTRRRAGLRAWAKGKAAWAGKHAAGRTPPRAASAMSRSGSRPAKDAPYRNRGRGGKGRDHAGAGATASAIERACQARQRPREKTRVRCYAGSAVQRPVSRSTAGTEERSARVNLPGAHAERELRSELQRNG